MWSNRATPLNHMLSLVLGAVRARVAGRVRTGSALDVALRHAWSNPLAGALILVYHALRRARQITVAGVAGCVAALVLRYITLRGGGPRISIPNALLCTDLPVVRESGTDAV
ncbi:MAG: hypothetical protein B7Z66_04505 [Chromatiales bacterium 21-64-14]|nr:MAG: hypothetical protein B7Z66_04505 [Chromatiales bacterium 21-64-14]HQU14591.1 hypothetical protein [Gammaproteobacteria bacterium]